MGRVLGLDGGGTKTVVGVADETGRVVMLQGGAGLDPVADAGWEKRLGDFVAGLGSVDAAVLGLPYFSEVPAISARQTAVALGLLGPRAQVVNDVAVAFEGALGGAEGVLVLAGTGSMAWARGPRGTVRSGGFGDRFGDEGSAYWIGRAALGVVSRHLDGRRRSAAFAEGMLRAMGIGGEELIAWTYEQAQPRVAIAGLAVPVSALAAAGNGEAARLIARAAGELAALGRAAARAAGLGAGFAWSYAGGALGDAVLRQGVADLLAAAPTAPVLPPIGGALILAARAAGWDTGPAFAANLAMGLKTRPEFEGPQPLA